MNFAERPSRPGRAWAYPAAPDRRLYCCRSDFLIRFYARRVYHACPAGELAPEEFAQPLRRPACDGHSLLFDRAAHGGVVEQQVELGVDLRNDRRGGAGGREDSIPGLDLELSQSVLRESR